MSKYYDQDLQLTDEEKDDVRIWNGKYSTVLTDKQVKDLKLDKQLWLNIFESIGDK